MFLHFLQQGGGTQRNELIIMYAYSRYDWMYSAIPISHTRDTRRVPVIFRPMFT